MMFTLKALWPKSYNEQRATSVPVIWVRNPAIFDQDCICLFVTYAPMGKIPSYSLVHAREWARAHFKVVLIVVVDEFDLYKPGPETDFASGLCVRLNMGYDFGAWAGAITDTPSIKKAGLLAVANDSLFGPFDGFLAMLGRIRQSKADVIGLTENFQIKHHIQSYIMFFSPRAVRKRAFLKFWRNLRVGNRDFVIENYELNFMSRMERAGLKTEVLFPITKEDCNPTLKYWRELITSGFPF